MLLGRYFGKRVRELVGLPVNVQQLRRASAFTVFEQFRGAVVPLAAALVMALCVLSARSALPASWSAAGRLAVLIPLGALSFGLVSLIAQRALLGTLVDLIRAAIGRAKPSPLPELSLGRAP